MDDVLSIAESSTLGLLTLITGMTPPRVIRDLLLPPLDIDMPAPSNDASPTPIQTQVKSAKSASTGLESLPSVGLAVYDNTVIPPSHGARTLVLCFDGTGDQFDSDVRTNMYLLMVAY